MELYQWTIIWFAVAGFLLVVQTLTRQFVPQRVQVEGNGHSLTELIESLITVQVERVEMARGPIIGTVCADGRTVNLHTEVDCVTSEGDLFLAQRVRPGSTLALLSGA